MNQRNPSYYLFLTTLLIPILFLSSCGNEKKEKTKSEGKKITVVTTTGIIADAVKNIAGDSVDITALMGPGVDPHLYKATQGDLKRLTDADVVIYNGLHLEGKMSEILKKFNRLKPVIAVADGLDSTQIRTAPEFQNAHDPHIWFNVATWTNGVNFISQQLQELDPKNAEFFQKNTEKYISQLTGLDQFVRERISQIPQQQRILITAHDAFGYFGEAYQIEVRGLQGLSTLSEFGLKDISDLVDLIVERNIKAVFVETSVSQRAIKAVVDGCQKRGQNVIIGGTLYSDALGEENTPEGTYIGMVKSNVQTI
ncbi:metal ABC transporter solute-binding protein, Zn/Mn family, partial [Xanthovirga aplysinae]|uniref:metal ABC transporter solute-binding protein, Zn/Mn family n=1 Tax=Xanthovirga aplysinae TaxID=2529853 RepID=UPI0012BD1887